MINESAAPLQGAQEFSAVVGGILHGLIILENGFVEFLFSFLFGKFNNKYLALVFDNFLLKGFIIVKNFSEID